MVLHEKGKWIFWIFSFHFFPMISELFIGLLSSPPKGSPISAAFNIPRLWCHWPQTPLSVHTPVGGGLFFGLYGVTVDQDLTKVEVFPVFQQVAVGSWRYQPAAWPWYSVGPCTPGPGSAPLPGSGPSLTPGAAGSCWAVPSACLHLPHAVLQTSLQISHWAQVDLQGLNCMSQVRECHLSSSYLCILQGDHRGALLNCWHQYLSNSSHSSKPACHTGPRCLPWFCWRPEIWGHPIPPSTQS